MWHPEQVSGSIMQIKCDDTTLYRYLSVMRYLRCNLSCVAAVCGQTAGSGTSNSGNTRRALSIMLITGVVKRAADKPLRVL